MVLPGFEPVREAFVDNFASAASWAGLSAWSSAARWSWTSGAGYGTTPRAHRWSADTMTLVHSTTKGLSAMVLALLHSRGLLDYDERVATYWPEFAQAGKEDITGPPAPGAPGRALRLRRAGRP